MVTLFFAVIVEENAQKFPRVQIPEKVSHLLFYSQRSDFDENAMNH